MSSLQQAATLLAGAKALRDLAPLATRLGFGSAIPLEAADRRALGLTSEIRRAQIASGTGALRALLVDVAGDAPFREAVARAATRTAATSPHLSWIVMAVQPRTQALAIAAPDPAVRTRVVALAVDRQHVMDSDGETLAAMIAAARGTDLLVHHRWRELMGREALTRRFYRELERTIHQMADTASGTIPTRERRALALLHGSRLLFLAFLEAKGWLDGDREFLRHAFDDRCAHGGQVHRRLLDPLFFGTLNTPWSQRASAARALGRIPFLNGGLFARTPLEKRCPGFRLSDDALGTLIGGLLARYRVTAREDSATWSEAAIDPEMLGRAFESLMASDERRASGAFFTPPVLIERVATEGLESMFAARGVPAEVIRAAHADRALTIADRARLREALAGLRILDPACGSGAFLVHVLERLAELARVAGDGRPVDVRRREILMASIFGVDVNPTAVWLCELRLWLSVVIESEESDPRKVTPLPNLDRHIRVGDALAGPAFDEAQAVWSANEVPPIWPAGGPASRSVATSISTPYTLSIRTSAELTRLRGRYARATGVRKRSLARALDREERRLAIAVLEREIARIAAQRRDLLGAVRSRDLFSMRIYVSPVQHRNLAILRTEARAARRRMDALRMGASLPFSFPVHFADTAAGGGFDLVVGNPPWVRPHHLAPAVRASLRTRFRTFRDAAWMAGAELTGAGRGFAAQADLASLFVERALALARPGGTIAFLLPAKLWRALAGGGVRRMLREEGSVRMLEDWTESRAVFDAAVYPSMLVATRNTEPQTEIPARTETRTDIPARFVVHRGHTAAATSWTGTPDTLPLDETPGAPWLLVPPSVRASFDYLTHLGQPLADSCFGRPLLGVKTGCNDAFLLRDDDETVEHTLLRPALRGESVRPWRATATRMALLWTHGSDDAPLERLPAGARQHLIPWRRRLEARTDGHGRTRWWSLFRTESARADTPRVVWSDIGRAPRALVLEAGDPTVPLNSCYVARAPSLDEAFALAALLNSPIAAAWLTTLAEPARGGYARFLGWTLARFPLPQDWTSTVRLLAPLAAAAHRGTLPDPDALVEVVMRAYGLRAPMVAPLLAWHRPS